MSAVALWLVTYLTALRISVTVARILGLEPSARLRATLATPMSGLTRLVLILPLDVATVYVVGRAQGWWA